ncbi:MAG TPA: substrate-binding domain-containing protein [Limnochordales bacterium]|nr:substrate-binding domain-containing protein [Limnochordales bacterium]
MKALRGRWITVVVWSMAAVLMAAGAALAQKAKEDIVLGLSTPALNTEFWVNMYYGVVDEAQRQGVQIIVLDAGGYNNTLRQIQQIQDLVQRRVDALLVGATNAEAVANVVEFAAARGIPVIGLSSLPATDKLAIRVGADHYDMGVLQAKAMAEALGGRGQVAIMAGPAGASWAEARRAGFRDTIAQYPGITIVAEQYSNSDRLSGLQLMEDWIARFPDLAGVYGATDDLSAGAADALEAAGLTGKVVVTGSNLSQIGRQYLAEGKIYANTAQQVVLQGRLAVQHTLKLLMGEPYETDIRTASVLVTAENLATVDMSTIAAPEGYRP